MQQYLPMIGIVFIFVIMYFLMIRPQKKREKQINEMRSALKVGDSITTIGGIKGKILSTKDDSLVIQVGSDKVKIEVMRWAISKMDESAAAKTKKPAEKSEEKEEDAPPARKPRKLTAKSNEETGSDTDATETDAEPESEEE